MVTTMASRFAVLSVDVDDDYSNKKNKKQKSVTSSTQPNTTKSDSNVKKKKKDQVSNSSNASNKVSNKKQLGGNPPGTKKKKKENSEPAEQWEQWKQADSKFVQGSYEDELTQAIMLSKLDYEEKKDVYDLIRKEEEKKSVGRKSKKGQRVMSLEEFNNLGSSREDSPSVSSVDNKENSEFFERIKEEVKMEITKEKNVVKKKLPREFNAEAVTIVQFQSEIEKRDEEIADLKQEVVQLKEELHNVKTRNKKLCQILANGEMKDKAEVLVEVERLQGVKMELSSEVQRLHVALEQERSKVRALTTDNKAKDKKKRTTSSCDNGQ